jgi:hypothetical protein
VVLYGRAMAAAAQFYRHDGWKEKEKTWLGSVTPPDEMENGSQKIS